MGIAGGEEHAVEADIQEVQLVQDFPLKLLVLALAPGFQITSQVAGVAAEGGGAEVVLGGQLAIGDPGQQGLIDVLPGIMVADSTAMGHGQDLRHKGAVQDFLGGKVAGKDGKSQDRRDVWQGKAAVSS